MNTAEFAFTSGFLEYRLHGERRKKRLAPGVDTRWEYGRITWREETSLDGKRIRIFCKTGKNIELISASFTAPRKYTENSAVFCNGFQSWTTSREYRTDECIPGLLSPGKIFRLDRYGDYHFMSSFRKGASLYSHSWTYIRDDTDTDFFGSLSESEGYTLFFHNPASGKLTVTRDCEGVMREHDYLLFDLFVCAGREEEVFTSYFTLLGLPERRKTLTGWTSWYNYYTEITEKIILENLEAFSTAGIPADVFQVDDGYQTAVGDWLSLKGDFPRGMKYIADRITASGYRPGIWLAPFVCSKHSNLRKKHPEWILTDSHGMQVCAGWNPGWDGPFYALDIYHEGFRAYLRKVFETVVSEWGYRVLKLDFLYAAGIIPRLGKSRGEVMAEGARFLSDICAGAEILGCGVPLGSCMGVFPFCRIGSDVAPVWEDKVLKFLRYRERVSTINSVMSTIGRLRLSGRAFLNDPDVFILREGIKMNRRQRETLFLLNVIFGDILFTSDYIGTYPPETMDLFRSLFPPRERRVQGVTTDRNLRIIDFTVGRTVYRAYANLGSQYIQRTLPEGEWVRQPTAWSSAADDRAGRVDLPAYATKYYQRLRGDFPRIAGGRGHLFPAAFVDAADIEDHTVSLRFSTDAPPEIRVHVLLPEPGRYRVNGRIRQAKENGSGGGIITCGSS